MCVRACACVLLLSFGMGWVFVLAGMVRNMLQHVPDASCRCTQRNSAFSMILYSIDCVLVHRTPREVSSSMGTTGPKPTKIFSLSFPTFIFYRNEVGSCIQTLEKLSKTVI